MALDITTIAATDKISDSRAVINTNFDNIATDLDALSDIAADTKITPVEKLTAKPIWDAIVAEKSDIDTQADAYSVNKTPYGTAYTNLNTYLNTTITVFASMTTTTTITRTDWDGFWNAYYNAKIEILQAIADATALLADWDGVTGTGKPEDNADVSPNFPSDENLVGYWSLDEGSGSKAYDGSGNSNDGTLVNMEEADWVDGVVGKCLDFGGTNEYVTLKADGFGTFDKQAYSISFWINPTALAQEVVWSYDFTSHVRPYYAQHIRIEADGDIFWAWNGTSGGDSLQTTNTPLSTGSWFHIVVTFESGHQKIYVNGELNISDTKTGTVVYYNQEVRLADSPNWAGAINAKLDEVRFYDKALTVKEVSALYKYPAGNKGNLPVAIAGINLKDSEANILKDRQIINRAFYSISTLFEDLGRFIITNSVVREPIAKAGIQLATSNTANKISKIVIPISSGASLEVLDKTSFSAYIHLHTIDTVEAGNDGVFYITNGESPNPENGTTVTFEGSDLYGFKAIKVNGVVTLYAIHSNNTTEVATSLGTITVAFYGLLTAIYDIDNSEIRFYLDDSLVATHNTGLPDKTTKTNYCARIGVSNLNTAYEFKWNISSYNFEKFSGLL